MSDKTTKTNVPKKPSPEPVKKKSGRPRKYFPDIDDEDERRRAYRKEYDQKNKERIREYNRARYHRMHDAMLELQKIKKSDS